MCVVSPVYMYVCVLYACLVFTEPRRGIGSLGIGISVSWEPPCRCWEDEPRSSGNTASVPSLLPYFFKVCLYVCVCRYICMCMLVYVCVLCMCICVYVYERGQLWVSSSVVHIIFLRQFLVEPETSWFSLTIWPIPFLPHQHWGYGYTGWTWVELKPSGLLCKHFTNRAISLAPLQFLCFL